MPALHALTNADLHCHSTFSDGTLSPPSLAERAALNGVEVWALTDHDEVAGIGQARTAAQALGMGFLAGVEISVSFAGQVVHIVGLGVDETDPRLIEGLRQTRGGRERRARDMAASLAAVGIPGAFEGALKHVGNPELISRTHFARFLVESGHCSDVGEVFRRFLKEGKPGFVPHRWAALGDAIRWIRESGGLAVIAHPARYDFTPTEEFALFSEFKAHGGLGVEVVTGSHSEAEMLRYADMALEFGLLASRGSDFHSPTESRTELGSLPALSGRLNPVWMALADRVQ
ncbi:3',5'-nucleoside bisphosphate phosphatase [Inhella gelatinilytica]|uniref:PHP domain-containing protein n=1 Tax=Inhella gelatinilytica TaxID=2795030 RepID=A0A931NAP4_9BURK|nr:3',5'-nucleoside bisphosphate phosphatase [Inhella gelatinilytica]MBH9552693.1 PHP domain-containing protein [Inhella gelatinilytica]